MEWKILSLFGKHYAGFSFLILLLSLFYFPFTPSFFRIILISEMEMNISDEIEALTVLSRGNIVKGSKKVCLYCQKYWVWPSDIDFHIKNYLTFELGKCIKPFSAPEPDSSYISINLPKEEIPHQADWWCRHCSRHTTWWDLWREAESKRLSLHCSDLSGEPGGTKSKQFFILFLSTTYI